LHLFVRKNSDHIKHPFFNEFIGGQKVKAYSSLQSEKESLPIQDKGDENPDGSRCQIH
jgi:hypothetical protein